MCIFKAKKKKVWFLHYFHDINYFKQGPQWGTLRLSELVVSHPSGLWTLSPKYIPSGRFSNSCVCGNIFYLKLDYYKTYHIPPMYFFHLDIQYKSFQCYCKLTARSKKLKPTVSYTESTYTEASYPVLTSRVIILCTVSTCIESS